MHTWMWPTGKGKVTTFNSSRARGPCQGSPLPVMIGLKNPSTFSQTGVDSGTSSDHLGDEMIQ